MNFCDPNLSGFFQMSKSLGVPKSSSSTPPSPICKNLIIDSQTTSNRTLGLFHFLLQVTPWKNWAKFLSLCTSYTVTFHTTKCISFLRALPLKKPNIILSLAIIFVLMHSGTFLLFWCWCKHSASNKSWSGLGTGDRLMALTSTHPASKTICLLSSAL